MYTPRKFAERLFDINRTFCQEVPSMVKTHIFVDDLIHLLFPVKSDRVYTLDQTEWKVQELQYRFRDLLYPLEPILKGSADEVTLEFFGKIPSLYESLLSDAETFMQFDPAAHCVEEIMLCYPGYYAIAIYRLSHELYKMNIPVLPRVISEYAHSKTGIDINPGAKIGEKFYIDHGTGIVIGETTEIGNNVKIYQGVTLGALYVDRELKDKKRHPTLQDNVIVYSGSTILGGKTIIGHDTTIGGNVWLTESVQPFSVVYHKPQIVIRDHKDFTEPLNFMI